MAEPIDIIAKSLDVKTLSANSIIVDGQDIKAYIDSKVDFQLTADAGSMAYQNADDYTKTTEFDGKLALSTMSDLGLGSLAYEDNVFPLVSSYIESRDYTAFEVFPTSAVIPAGTTTDIRTPIDDWKNPIPATPYKAYVQSMLYNGKYYIATEDTYDIFPDQSSSWQEVTEIYKATKVYAAGDVVLFEYNGNTRVYIRKDTEPGASNRPPTVQNAWRIVEFINGSPGYQPGNAVAVQQLQKIYTAKANTYLQPGIDEGWENYWNEGVDGYEGYFYEYKVDVPANMKLNLQFFSYKERKSDCDVVIDFGDGTPLCRISTATAAIGWVNQQQQSMFVVSHTYAEQRKFIVKIFGTDYFMVRNGYYDANPIISRAFDSDLPTASCLKNVSSLCLNAQKLVKVSIPYEYSFSPVNLAGSFQNCKNLRDFSIDGGVMLDKLQTIGGMFYNDTNLESDISNFSQLFQNWFEAPNMESVFGICQKIKGTVNPKLFWENPGNMLVPASNTYNMFANCSQEIRAQVPATWGGTMQPPTTQKIAYDIGNSKVIACEDGIVKNVVTMSQHPIEIELKTTAADEQFALNTAIKPDDADYVYANYGDSNNMVYFDTELKETIHTYSKPKEYTIKLNVDINQADGMTKILSGGGFSENNQTIKVKIPSTVAYIGGRSLYKLSSLADVKFEDDGDFNLSAIQASFCYECNNLSSVVLPDGVQYVGSDYLYNCPKLEYAYFPSSVLSIGGNVMRNNSSITTYAKRYALFFDHTAEVSSSTATSFFGYNGTSILSIVVPDALYDTWWTSSPLNVRRSFLKKFSAVSADLLSKGIIDENGHIVR